MYTYVYSLLIGNIVYIIVSQLLDEVAQSDWLIIVYCDVAISDWIMKHNNYPFISNVSQMYWQLTFGCKSSAPININTLNCVWILAKSVIRSLNNRCTQHFLQYVYILTLL